MFALCPDHDLCHDIIRVPVGGPFCYSTTLSKHLFLTLSINRFIPVDTNRRQIGLYCFQGILNEVTTNQ